MKIRDFVECQRWLLRLPDNFFNSLIVSFSIEELFEGMCCFVDCKSKKILSFNDSNGDCSQLPFRINLLRCEQNDRKKKEKKDEQEGKFFYFLLFVFDKISYLVDFISLGNYTKPNEDDEMPNISFTFCENIRIRFYRDENVDVEELLNVVNEIKEKVKIREGSRVERKLESFIKKNDVELKPPQSETKYLKSRMRSMKKFLGLLSTWEPSEMEEPNKMIHRQRATGGRRGFNNNNFNVYPPPPPSSSSFSSSVHHHHHHHRDPFLQSTKANNLSNLTSSQGFLTKQIQKKEHKHIIQYYLQSLVSEEDSKILKLFFEKKFLNHQHQHQQQQSFLNSSVLSSSMPNLNNADANNDVDPFENDLDLSEMKLKSEIYEDLKEMFPSSKNGFIQPQKKQMKQLEKKMKKMERIYKTKINLSFLPRKYFKTNFNSFSFINKTTNSQQQQEQQQNLPKENEK